MKSIKYDEIFDDKDIDKYFNILKESFKKRFKYELEYYSRFDREKYEKYIGLVYKISEKFDEIYNILKEISTEENVSVKRIENEAIFQVLNELKKFIIDTDSDMISIFNN